MGYQSFWRMSKRGANPSQGDEEMYACLQIWKYYSYNTQRRKYNAQRRKDNTYKGNYNRKNNTYQRKGNYRWKNNNCQRKDNYRWKNNWTIGLKCTKYCTSSCKCP